MGAQAKEGKDKTLMRRESELLFSIVVAFALRIKLPILTSNSSHQTEQNLKHVPKF